MASHRERSDVAPHPQAIVTFDYDRGAGELTIRIQRAAGFVPENFEKLSLYTAGNEHELVTDDGTTDGPLLEGGETFRVPVEPGTDPKLVVVTDDGASTAIDEYTVPETEGGTQP